MPGALRLYFGAAWWMSAEISVLMHVMYGSTIVWPLAIGTFVLATGMMFFEGSG